MCNQGHVLLSFQLPVKLEALLLCYSALNIYNYSFITRTLLDQAIDSGVACPLTMGVLPVSGAVHPALGTETEQLSSVILYQLSPSEEEFS